MLKAGALEHATSHLKQARPMIDKSVEVPSPLKDCFLHCEVECVRECCGLDAFSTDLELIVGWCRTEGSTVARQALAQLTELQAVAEDRSRKMLCSFLNHFTVDEAARE